MRDLKWSTSEKIVARKVFDQALHAELREIIHEAKNMAASMEEVSEVWNSQRWLTHGRVEIRRKYDYRYSVLPFVFATLVKEGRISENDLYGQIGKRSSSCWRCITPIESLLAGSPSH
jgi:hypothetical protein